MPNAFGADAARGNGPFFVIFAYFRCPLRTWCMSRVGGVEKCQDDAVGHSRALPGVILGQDLESPADFATGTTLL